MTPLRHAWPAASGRSLSIFTNELQPILETRNPIPETRRHGGRRYSTTFTAHCPLSASAQLTTSSTSSTVSDLRSEFLLYFPLPNPGPELAFVLTLELQSAVIGATAGGIFYITALLLRTWLSNRSDHNAARHESRVRFLTEQISLLYGPLLGYLHETTAYYGILRAITARLRADGEAAGEDAGVIEQRIHQVARRFDEEYFTRINRQIAALMRSKRHLIAEERFPDYLQRYLAHAADWDATRLVVQELGRKYDYAGISGQQWPEGIVSQTEQILYSLRSDYRRHLKKLGRMM